MRRFFEYNPAAVMLYFIAVTGITMFTVNPVIVGLSLFASALNFALYTKGGLKSHIFSAILFVVLAAANPLFVHRGMTVLFYLNDRPITLEAAVYGVTAAGTVVASLYWLRLLGKVMTSDRLLYLFGRISPKIALILSMAIRYVELFRARWRRIQDAQRALGLYDDGNLIDALKGRARVLSILITWSLENGIITAESMEGRGWGVGRRTSFALYRIRIHDMIVMAVCTALAAVGIIGVAAAEVGFYPMISMELTRPLSIAGYVGFGILALLPVIINTKEAIRWRFLISAG